MSFDRAALIEACRTYGPVTRVVVAALRGSGPREVGAAMLVWHDGFSGTIGGGTLEFQAISNARQHLTPGHQSHSRHALGPDLGQCCGGAVELWSECFDLDQAQSLPEDVIFRGSGEMPLAVTRLQAQSRNSGHPPAPQFIAGWMVEPVIAPTRHLWIWGAGHVGRALVDVFRPLPQMHLTWIDTHQSRFPGTSPAGVDLLVARAPEDLVKYAPATAEHVIVTYSHDLDLALCHHLLSHGFAFAGLIGSATKWARFRSRLHQLGHAQPQIDRITCPIGNPALGKHPQAIAIGVGAAILHPAARASTTLEKTA
ncbi:MAG: xanthine dehydrogenase accessory protein XdhC [Roseobacter sp.]